MSLESPPPPVGIAIPPPALDSGAVAPAPNGFPSDGSALPSPMPAPVSLPTTRSFGEYLHDHFDAVYKRVTMGRRDLKSVKMYFENRAEGERAYAARLAKDANIPDLQDSSSIIGVWKDVKDTALQTGNAHAALGQLCLELAAHLDKTIKEMKATKTALQNRYNKQTEDSRVKQQKHDKARDQYSDAVRQSETAIQQRDSGRSLPPQKQQPLENAVQRAMANLNHKHDEYRRSVQALKESQMAYDAGVIEIMQQFEQLETARLIATHQHLERFANQHDQMAQSIQAISQQLHRSIANINTARDVQEYISATTTNTKPRPHVEYHEIQSAVIQQFQTRATQPPQQLSPVPVPGTVPVNHQQPQPFSPVVPPQPMQPAAQFAPPAQYSPMGAPPQAVTTHVAPGPAFVTGAAVAGAVPVVVNYAAPQGSPVGKFIPPPVTDRFVPPTVAAAPTAVALYDFDSNEPDDLTFKVGEVIVLKQCDDNEDWWTGELRGRTGIFPKTYCQIQKPVGSSEEGVAPVVTAVPVASNVQQPVPVTMASNGPVMGEPVVSAPISGPISIAAPAPIAPASQPGESEVANGAVEQPREMNARCEALFDFVGQDVDELSFKKGDQLLITGELNGWYLGKIEGSNQVGIFPSNYVSLM